MDVWKPDYEGSALEALHNSLRDPERAAQPSRPRCSDAMWALDVHEDNKGKKCGGCRRRLVYAYSGLEKEDPSPEALLRMAVGTAIHERLQEVWAPAAGIQLVDCEKEWRHTFDTKVGELTITGHPDGLDLKPCPEGYESNVFELKTGGDGYFSEMWAFGHVPLLAKAEANLHAWKLEREHLAFMHIRVGLEGAGGGAQLWARYDEGMRDEVLEGFIRCWETAMLWEPNTFPRGFDCNKARKSKEHGYVHPLPWQCNGCPFVTTCRQDQDLVAFQDRGLDRLAVLNPDTDIPEVMP